MDESGAGAAELVVLCTGIAIADYSTGTHIHLRQRIGLLPLYPAMPFTRIMPGLWVPLEWQGIQSRVCGSSCLVSASGVWCQRQAFGVSVRRLLHCQCAPPRCFLSVSVCVCVSLPLTHSCVCVTFFLPASSFLSHARVLLLRHRMQTISHTALCITGDANDGKMDLTEGDCIMVTKMGQNGW